MLRRIGIALAGVSAFLSHDLQAQNSSYDSSQSVWFQGDYLYWKIKDSPKIIPLVIQGPRVLDGSPILGEPGTEIIMGNKKIPNKWRSGAQFSLGYWLNDQHCIGIEAQYFFLAKTTKKKSVFSDGTPGSAFLTIPFFDVNTGRESSNAIADSQGDPAPFSGLAVLKNSNNMQGAELNALATVLDREYWNIGLLGGFRYWNFNEHLSFNTSSPFLPPFIVDVFKTYDKFQVRNHFYGGQIGTKLDYMYKSFFFNLKAKIALGALCQTSRIRGRLYSNDFNGYLTPINYLGGYFALSTNIGDHKRTQFSVIPEVNVNLGYQVVDCLRLQVGYSFLYASNVLWASKQVDRHINPTQSYAIQFSGDVYLVGEEKPKGSLRTEGLWVHGVNVGLELKF